MNNKLHARGEILFITALRRKAGNILASHQQYKAQFKGLSMDDML